MVISSLTTECFNNLRSRTLLADNVATEIATRIEQGRYLPGSALPARQRLAQEYGVSKETMQQAITKLVRKGVVRSENGRGTFVLDRPASSFAGYGDRESVLPPLWDKGLRKETITVGVLADLWQSTAEPEDNWPLTIVKAVEWKLSSVPRVRMRFLSDDCTNAGNRADVVRRLSNGEADGLIIVGGFGYDLNDFARLAESAEFPVVLASMEPNFRFPCVFFDSEHAGYQAGRHLIEQGYRDIAYFCPLVGGDWIDSRLSGLNAALSEAGLRLTEVACDALKRESSKPDQLEASYTYAKRFISEIAGRHLGIVAVNDNAGYGFIKAAEELGLRAGRDFGLIGFDDRSQSRMLDMSSLHPPLDAIGAEAAKLFLQLLRGENVTTQIRLHSYLIPRGSTRSIHELP